MENIVKRGRIPLHPGKEVYRICLTLTSEEMERLDKVAQKLRNSRSNAAALLIIKALEQEERIF